MLSIPASGCLDPIFGPEILNIDSVHAEMANLPDSAVARKIESSEYPPYACG
jgi:hypothetical protein